MVMVDFHANKDIVVNASPEAIFSPVSDLPKHQELHGSGESVEVRKLTQGPTALDSMVPRKPSWWGVSRFRGVGTSSRMWIGFP